MSIKPILFNTEMVRAILDGRKTVTRRVVKFRENRNPNWTGYVADGAVLYGSNNIPAAKAPYRPGDILYVREKFACDGFDGEKWCYVYWTDVDDCGQVVWGDLDKGEWAPRSDYRWCPSIHMPREAARIFLRVTDVRVERLQEMTETDIRQEGVIPLTIGTEAQGFREPAVYYEAFESLWDSTVKPADLDKCGWGANPWVWVIEFERVEVDHD